MFHSVEVFARYCELLWSCCFTWIICNYHQRESARWKTNAQCFVPMGWLEAELISWISSIKMYTGWFSWHIPSCLHNVFNIWCLPNAMRHLIHFPRGIDSFSWDITFLTRWEFAEANRRSICWHWIFMYVSSKRGYAEEEVCAVWLLYHLSNFLAVPWR